jgi:hypothetical protein
MNLRLRRGFLMVEKIPDNEMTLGLILNPTKVIHRVNLIKPNPKTFHYEAHCVIHEPHKFDEDLTGCHLIIDHLAGIEYMLPVNGRQRTVHFILESAVLAVIENDRRQIMNIGALKNFVKGMLETELTGLADTDPVSEEVIDNLDTAFTAILDNARDEDDDDDEDEEDEDDEITDDEANYLDGPPPTDSPDTEVKR